MKTQDMNFEQLLLEHVKIARLQRTDQVMKTIFGVKNPIPNIFVQPGIITDSIKK